MNTGILKLVAAQTFVAARRLASEEMERAARESLRKHFAKYRRAKQNVMVDRYFSKQVEVARELAK